MAYLVLNRHVFLFAAEDGYVAYDSSADRLHQFNPLASLIVELCDGSRTSDDIIELVQPFVPTESAPEIAAWIGQAMDAGVLVEAAPGQANEPSVKELTNLAHRMNDTGRHQVAYLAWKRATELSPEDADAWYWLGDTAYWLGRLEEARAAYTKYLTRHPEDAELQQLVIGLGKGAPPSRAPNDCIEQIYRRMSSDYDTLMRERLDYQAPERLRDAIESVTGNRGGMTILDLGCGSGLSGSSLKDKASLLVGIDLSPEMIDLARKRGIYDRLEVAEITDWLARHQARFDLIVICECLVYFGDLRDVVAAAAQRLHPGCVLALTVERGGQYPFSLTHSGRYAHHFDHVREAARAAGLSPAYLEEGFLRKEYGAPVTGLYAVLTKDAVS
jgi:predicted TPR repeat methyltransferase